MNKKVEGATFARGAALVPTDKLIEWLDGQKLGGKPRLLRLPVVLSGAFELASARIGGVANALQVYANDAALGNGLTDRARAACNGRDTCAFWVEAYWRGKTAGGYEIEVMKVHSTIAPDELARVDHVEVEGESGN